MGRASSRVVLAESENIGKQVVFLAERGRHSVPLRESAPRDTVLRKYFIPLRTRRNLSSCQYDGREAECLCFVVAWIVIL